MTNLYECKLGDKLIANDGVEFTYLFPQGFHEGIHIIKMRDARLFCLTNGVILGKTDWVVTKIIHHD